MDLINTILLLIIDKNDKIYGEGKKNFLFY